MSSRYHLFKALFFVGLLVSLRGEFPNLNLAQAPDDSILAHANPAALYCRELGYDYKTEETPTGSVGVCVLPGGLACGEWDFLTGKCGAEYSACARNGYQLEVRNAGESSYSQEYAMCLDSKGKEVGTVETLTNLPEKATSACLPSESAFLTEEEPLEAVSPGSVQANPSSFDWRSRPAGNYLTSVKNQGICGSCWAFSAVGVTEAALNIANNTTGNNYDLSEQYLVSDCLSGHDCCGGVKSTALNYIKNSGVPDDACMSYVDGTGCGCNNVCGDTASCTYNSSVACSDRACSNRCSNWSTRLKKLSAWGYVSSASDTIKSTLISKGPLAVSLRMNGTFDANDVYRCSPDTPTNHAVVIVGYNDTGGYWIVRNSWGATWNGDGHFKVGYGECSIESSVYYATAIASYPTNCKVHLPTVMRDAFGSLGFYSDFNGNATGWVYHPGAVWYYNSANLYTYGTPNKWSSVSYNQTFNNFTYEARMKRTQYASEGGYWHSNGMIVRGTPTFGTSNNWSNAYYFLYHQNGRYSVGKYVSGAYTALKSWTDSASILKNDWNTLKVTANGASLRFYINGALVWSGTDYSFSSGRVGLALYRGNDSTTMSVDWARLTSPEASIAAELDQVIEPSGVDLFAPPASPDPASGPEGETQ